MRGGTAYVNRNVAFLLMQATKCLRSRFPVLPFSRFVMWFASKVSPSSPSTETDGNL